MNKVAGLALAQEGRDDHDTITLHPVEAQKGGPYAYYHRKRAKKLVLSKPKKAVPTRITTVKRLKNWL